MGEERAREVIQADRIIAASIFIAPANAKACLAGERDDHPITQMVAKHREAFADEARLAERERTQKAIEHIAEQIIFAETRIADGKELGATVWRLALEDIVRENRAILTAILKPHP